MENQSKVQVEIFQKAKKGEEWGIRQSLSEDMSWWHATLWLADLRPRRSACDDPPPASHLTERAIVCLTVCVYVWVCVCLMKVRYHLHKHKTTFPSSPPPPPPLLQPVFPVISLLFIPFTLYLLPFLLLLCSHSFPLSHKSFISPQVLHFIYRFFLLSSSFVIYYISPLSSSSSLQVICEKIFQPWFSPTILGAKAGLPLQVDFPVFFSLLFQV